LTTDRPNENENKNEYESSLTGGSVVVLFLAMALGVLAAVLVLPNWLPGMAGSLSGPDPKAFWYLSRGTAFVAMGLLWASMMLGLGITNKMARLWPGAPAAFALHEYLSLLGLAFAAFHGLILLGDHYTNFSLLQVLIPFATWNYYPFWVGLGQLGFYAWALLVVSFYIRKHIGQRTWRLLHFVSFLAYLGALLHGLTSGTDTGLGWVQGFYWLTGGSFLFLFTYRVVNCLVGKVERYLSSPAQQ
jgi:predicted ferric reductase